MGGPGDGPQLEGHGRRDVPPRRGGGSEGVSHMMAARAVAVSAGKAAGLQRPARPPQRPSMRVYRRAPPGYQFPLPLYRPTRRSLASWFGSACIFGLKLLASGLAGVLVATALWHDQWKSASAPAAVGKRDRGLFQPWGNHRLSPRTGARRRGSRLGSGVHGRRGPGAAVELSASGQDDDLYASGAGSHRRDPARRAQSAPVDSGSRVSSRNARSSRARSWSPPPSSGE